MSAPFLRTFAFVLCCGCLAAACNAGPSAPPEPNIDASKARELALSRYRQLFGDKFLLNPISNDYHPWPPLNESRFDWVEEKETFWIVRADPETGVVIDARVDKRGKWVELRRVSFAFE